MNQHLQAIITIDPGEVAPLAQDLIRGEHAKEAMAINSQKLVNAANERIERAHIEGLGQLEAVVHPDVYFRMMHLHGVGCWGDSHFLRSWKRHNGAPRSRARKTTVRV